MRSRDTHTKAYNSISCVVLQKSNTQSLYAVDRDVRAELHATLMHSSINGFCFSKSIAAGDIYHGQPYSTYIYIYIMDCRNTFIQPSLESPPPISIHLEMMRYANYPHPLHIQIYLRGMNQYIRMYQAKDNSKFHCSFDLYLGNNRVVMMIVVSLSLCNKIEIPQPNIVNHNYTIE